MSRDYTDIPYREDEPSAPENDADIRLWSDGGSVKGKQSDGGLAFDVDSASIVEQKPTRKLGVIGDTHWGRYGTIGLASDETELKSVLDEFAADMNSWGADEIIHLGDIANGSSASSQSEAEQWLADFRNYLETQADGSGVDASVNYVIGNHEGSKESSWGADWYLDELGYSTASDTYYALDFPEAKILVLNLCYGGDYQTNSLVSGELDWLESQLETTSKPVVLASHIPISEGTGALYDSLSNSTDDEYKLPHLINQYQNVVCGIFGHDHYDVGGSSGPGRDAPTFDHSLVQYDRHGTPHIYQHYPFQLAGDRSVRPWGKLKLYSGGWIRYDQSYLGDDTGYQDRFKLEAGNRSQPFEQRFLRNTDYHWETSFDSLDGFATPGDGSVGFGGTDSARVELSTGATSGNYQTLKKRVDHMRGVDKGGSFTRPWPSCILRVTADMATTSGVDAYLIHGILDSGGNTVGEDNHIGFHFNSSTGNWEGSVASGGSQSTVDLGQYSNNPAIMEARYYADKGRVDFYGVGYKMNDGSSHPTSLSTNIPSGDVGGAKRPFGAYVESTDGNDKTLHLIEAELYRSPHLEIVQ